jgi:hypothetical protein
VTASPIRLHLVRRGGLAGIPLQATVDTAELDPAEAEAIHAALDAADLRALAARPPQAPGMPDAFSYELEVERGAEKHRLVFGEHDVPEPLRQTVELLKARAGPAKR